MRYTIDWNGYVTAVAFGCYLENCIEYTGEVPAGYSTLDDWATNARINAYYLNSEGNLIIDHERQAELKRKAAQQAVDNAPLLRKDLYGSDEILDSQYIKSTASGEVITLNNIQAIMPRVKVTGIQPYEYGKFEIFTHGKNMLPCDAVDTSCSGISFTRLESGRLDIRGTATADIEYTIAGSDANEEVLFVMKKGKNYYLNLGGLACEMRHTSGELTKQKYAGSSGLINLSESIEVTQVLIKIPKGSTVANSFYPQLEVGNTFTTYEKYKKKSIVIDFSEYVAPRGLYPSDALYPHWYMFPNELTYFTDTTVEYILLENGVIYASVNGIKQAISGGSVGLFNGYDTIYATQDTTLEIEYSTNVYDIDSLEFMQGKETPSKRFRVAEDGSIEAHNGYFSGRVEADSGSFKGRVEADSGYFKGKVEANEGYFKGKIEADSGYFKGRVEANEGYFKGKVEANEGSFKGRVEADEGYFKGRIEANEGYFKGKIESSDVTVTGGSIQITKPSFDFDVFSLKSDEFLLNCTSGSYEAFCTTNKHYASYGHGSASFGTFTGEPHGNGSAMRTDSYYGYNALVGGTLYTASGTVSKSDRNTKTDIEELDTEKASEFIYSLKPSKYKYKDGTSDRYHHGFIAQDVKESMGTEDWGVYVDTSLDENDDNDIKMLRYEELIADLVATVQQQNKRIAQLEERIGNTNE